MAMAMTMTPTSSTTTSTMIVFWAALSSLMVATTRAAVMPEIQADSALGRSLLHHARRVNQDNNKNQQDNQELYAWVSSYSVKFQGCMSIKQWNVHADADEDVRIATKSLVRFRLCPSDTCSASKAAGCTSAYGDYIIDLNLYMAAHTEAVRRYNEVTCENYLNAKCSCDNDNYCQYDCFNDAGMHECIDRNPYDGEQQQQQQQFRVEDYMECRQIKANGQKRHLEGGGDQVKYYVGPYCGNQGGDVYLGLFTDDSCTEFAKDIDFASVMGYELPYTSQSLVSSKCVQCTEPVRDQQQQNGNQHNDEVDGDQVNESCETLYLYSGKCETNLPSGTVQDRNENGCNYMQGIKIVRYDGIIDRSAVRPSAIATAFIVIFAMAFSAMAFYVWYLRTRLGMKQNTLL